MALVLADRVRETTTTAGTGTLTLSGTAVVGYQTFGAGVGNGNETYYTIAGQGTTEWEVGIGTYSVTGPTLTRDTVLASSANGAKVDFPAGTKDVFVTYPAEKAITDGYGLLPVTNGGTGTNTQFTAGSVVFAGASGVYSQDNANLFWDDTNNRLGIGTSSPGGRLDLNGNFVSNITAVAASAIDCTSGNFFTKTASGALTWTISNAPASRAYSFLLELTNGGTGTQTWFTGIKWPGGTAPTLTASGVDLLGFITDDGGTTWRGVQLMKDSK